MKPDQFNFKHPVVASILVIIAVTALTEAPIQGIRGALAPLTGRFFLTNLIFGAAHVTNLLMGRGTPLYAAAQFGYAFSFGVFFSALCVRSGSIFLGAIAHGFFNFVSGLDAFAPGAQPLSEVVRSTTADELISSLVITLPLLLVELFFFRKSQVDVPPADGPRQSYSELATAF